MTPDPPGHNPQTRLDEPVYLFTDKALVPPTRQKETPPPGNEQPKPSSPEPEEEVGQ